MIVQLEKMQGMDEEPTPREDSDVQTQTQGQGEEVKIICPVKQRNLKGKLKEEKVLTEGKRQVRIRRDLGVP